MRNVLEYVLRNEKVKEGYVEIAGPYSGKTINYDDVYQSWLAEKKLWDKDSGRMYAHNIIGFHKDEQITPKQVLEIGKEFAEKFFSGHQYVIGVHQDKDHLHCHIVTNSVSYINGLKLHQTKQDLELQKSFTNHCCQERGLTIAEKGKHFDGTTIEEGEIIAWRKDKYNLLINDGKKSYVAECAMAILESKDKCCSKTDFIKNMEERGWQTFWADTKKHITFQNENGDKVRDSNLSKTFEMNINKEALIHEFERQNEIILNKLNDNREREQYYSKAKSTIYGERTSGSGINEDNKSTNRNRTNDTTRSGEDTTSFIRELRSKERASAKKRDNSIIERADREAARERSRTEAEREAQETKQRPVPEHSRHQTRSQSYDIER